MASTLALRKVVDTVIFISRRDSFTIRQGFNIQTAFAIILSWSSTRTEVKQLLLMPSLRKKKSKEEHVHKIQFVARTEMVDTPWTIWRSQKFWTYNCSIICLCAVQGNNVNLNINLQSINSIQNKSCISYPCSVIACTKMMKVKYFLCFEHSTLHTVSRKILCLLFYLRMDQYPERYIIDMEVYTIDHYRYDNVRKSNIDLSSKNK